MSYHLHVRVLCLPVPLRPVRRPGQTFSVTYTIGVRLVGYVEGRYDTHRDGVVPEDVLLSGRSPDLQSRCLSPDLQPTGVLRSPVVDFHRVSVRTCTSCTSPSSPTRRFGPESPVDSLRSVLQTPHSHGVCPPCGPVST